RHVGLEPGADDADAHLGHRLEVAVVDDRDALDARAARPDLVRVGDERPDAVARRGDLDGAFEVHRSGLGYWNARRRKAAIWPRVTRPGGQYFVPPHPFVTSAWATKLMFASWVLPSSSVKAFGALPVSSSD